MIRRSCGIWETLVPDVDPLGVSARSGASRLSRFEVDDIRVIAHRPTEVGNGPNDEENDAHDECRSD